MTTKIDINKNQTVKNNESFPLMNVVTKSWIKPQKTNVRIKESINGNIRFNGRNIFVPK